MSDSIAIIYMGGTFGCIGEPLSPMPAPHFFAQLKQHYPQADYHFVEAPVIKDSTELSVADWLLLAEQIHTLAQQGFQSFIVIHGTDTLAYAGAFLHHFFAQQYRIVITGSQFPILDVQGQSLRANSDASENFNFALAEIKHAEQGVYVAFNQQLFYANSCYKQHTEDFNAFTGTLSNNYSPTHSLNIAQSFDFSKDNIENLIQNLSNVRIDHLYLTPMPAQQLQQQLLQRISNPETVPSVLFIQSFGSGNLPYSKQLKTTIQQLIQHHHCQIIISSQVLFGTLSQKYATGSWLSDTAVLFDTHISQADSFIRAKLLCALHPTDWQTHWDIT